MSDFTTKEQPAAATAGPLIAGFWRRVAAFAVDGLILAVPAFIIGFVFYQWAAGLGQAGRLIGLFVMLFYFVYFDSEFGGGQTLGKRLLDIKIVQRRGNMLSPMHAILRCLVIGIPYYLNGVWIDDGRLPLWQQHLIAVPLTFLVFGCGGAIVYLFIFNRRTRQSLHDLAVGSYIVRCSAGYSPITLSTPRLHLAIMSCFLFLALALPISSGIRPNAGALAQSQKPLLDMQTAIQKHLGVQRVGIYESSTAFWSNKQGASTQTFLAVTVQDNHWRGNLSSLTPKIAAIVIAQAPDLLGKHILSIHVLRGFDLGIASWSESFNESHDEASWLSTISGNSTAKENL